MTNKKTKISIILKRAYFCLIHNRDMRILKNDFLLSVYGGASQLKGQMLVYHFSTMAFWLHQALNPSYPLYLPMPEAPTPPNPIGISMT